MGEHAPGNGFSSKPKSILYNINWRGLGVRARAWCSRGGCKLRGLGKANTLALLQLYSCHMFAQSLCWETQPLSYIATQQQKCPCFTKVMVITEQWRHHLFGFERVVQYVCNSSYASRSLLNSSFQPYTAFSENSENEYNSLCSVTFPMRLKAPLRLELPESAQLVFC